MTSVCKKANDADRLGTYFLQYFSGIQSVTVVGTQIFMGRNINTCWKGWEISQNCITSLYLLCYAFFAVVLEHLVKHVYSYSDSSSIVEEQSKNVLPHYSSHGQK